jgi:hypothetical protein
MHLIDFLTARDGECVFPTCHQPAHRCQIEHCQPFDAGGKTCPGNNALTCHRHNESKKPDAPFSYVINPDGSTLWTHHPTGRSYPSQPRHRWPQPEPDTPAPETETARHQREDQDYATHIAQLRIQRTRARKTSDRNAETAADQALKDTHTQRQRELRHRADPNYPPF